VSRHGSAIHLKSIKIMEFIKHAISTFSTRRGTRLARASVVRLSLFDRKIPCDKFAPQKAHNLMFELVDC
jgi:hypothetical protein